MKTTRDIVAETLVTAASTFREDQKEAYRRAIAAETDPKARWILEQVLENAMVAERTRGPLCDDTGIPHLFLEIGPGGTATAGLLAEIRAGVAEGLRRLPGRPMAVMGGDMERIDQSGGLSADSADVLPAPIAIRETDEDVLRLTVLMLGGGPAIRGITHRIFHRHSVEAVLDEIAARATEGMRNLGCSPCTLAVGIGRSQYEATSLMLEAMAKGNYGVQTDFEREITRRVNAASIGPLGLGGGTSALATFARVGPQRASGVRIVAIRPCCCFEPRRATVNLRKEGEPWTK
jgi:fumarate hydratase subunit alpha